MRIKRSVNALKKRRKTLRLAKGYRGTKSSLYRVAREQVMKSGQYAYIGRRLKKRDFRKLWIARINAAARQNDITYSRLMDGLLYTPSFSASFAKRRKPPFRASSACCCFKSSCP